MQTASKKVINGWAMYDWANSVYNLVITSTIFPIILSESVTKNFTAMGRCIFLGRKFVNTRHFIIMRLAMDLFDCGHSCRRCFLPLPITKAIRKRLCGFFASSEVCHVAAFIFFKGTDTFLDLDFIYHSWLHWFLE